MKTEVNLCDECKQRVSKRKCDFCERDICDDCNRSISIQLWRENSLVTRTTSLNFCKKCYKEKDLTKMQGETILNISDEIKKIFIENIKKKIIIKRLK